MDESMPSAPPVAGVALRRGGRTALVSGLAFGLTADLLLRAEGEPGLNLLLLAMALALAMGVVARRGGIRLTREALAWMTVGILLGLTFVFRGAPALHGTAFLAAALAFALPALRAGKPWLRGSGIGDQMEAVAGAILHAGLGVLRLLADRPRPGGDDGREVHVGAAADAAVRGAHRGRQIRGVLVGGLLAVPLLLVFGALFMSADAVFADLVTGALGTLDPEILASHLLLTAALGWLAAGYLVGLLSGTRLREALPPGLPRPSLGAAEVGTTLALVDLLFAAFVLVQIRYLFGGRGVVELTPGLTYAAYAREGFIQLVLATALVLPTLLLAEWLLRHASPRGRRIFRILGGAQLLLLLVIIASAIQRLRVYQEAYGLTGSRLYGAVFLAWLTFVAAWFAVTVLRGRRHRFASVALVSLYFTLAGLIVSNPDVRIARVNLARLDPVADASFDADYLGTLGPDAVPILVDALPRLPREAQCTLARGLDRRWGAPDPGDWRTWNRPRSQARNAVEDGVGRWLEGCPDDRG